MIHSLQCGEISILSISQHVWFLYLFELKCAKLKKVIFHVKINEWKCFIISLRESDECVRNECEFRYDITMSFVLHFGINPLCLSFSVWRFEEFHKISNSNFLPFHRHRWKNSFHTPLRSPVNWPWLKLILNVQKNVPKLVKRKHRFNVSLILSCVRCWFPFWRFNPNVMFN